MLGFSIHLNSNLFNLELNYGDLLKPAQSIILMPSAVFSREFERDYICKQICYSVPCSILRMIALPYFSEQTVRQESQHLRNAQLLKLEKRTRHNAYRVIPYPPVYFPLSSRCQESESSN